VRGWCTDRSRPKQRLTLQILVNGIAIGQVVADRPHARLIEQGEGDGRYAFAMVIPQEFRDGVTRAVDVRVLTPGYEGTHLKTRAAEFALQPDLAIPTMKVKSVTADWLDGILVGVSNRKFLNADIWLDGHRVPDADYSLQWLTRTDQAAVFRLRLEGQSPLNLLRHAAIGYPGVHEALGNAIPLASAVRFEIVPLDGDAYRVSVDPQVVLPEGYVLRAEASLGDEVQHRLELTFRRNVARFTLPADLSGRQMTLRLFAPNDEPFGSAARIPRAGSRRNLVQNTAFARWSGSSPDHWEIPEGIERQRAFYAFDEAMRAQTGVSGQTLVVHLAGGQPEMLLCQPLRTAPLAGETEFQFGLLARASQATTVELRLADRTGRTVASRILDITPQWATNYATVAVSSQTEAAASFEIWTTGAVKPEGLYLEMAGLRCGDESASFADTTGERVGGQFGENLVVNSALQRWPNGLSFSDARRRFEITEGWHFYKRGMTSDARIAAVPAVSQDGSAIAGCYAMSLAVETVEEHCRVEIALATETLRGDLRLKFWAMSGTVFDPPTARFDRAMRWASIDRISVVKRSFTLTDGEPARVDQIVAVLARRVMLRRQIEAFQFDVSADVAEGEDDEAEYILLLEFNRPVSMTLHGLELRLDDSREGQSSGIVSGLSLEDRNVASQVPFIKGLESWHSEATVLPAVRANDQTSPPAPPQRWSWRYSAMGTVEVVVCVHNAVEETLNCLKSLVGTTTVPHTVHVINDASDSDGRHRLIQYIADKPWMRLSDNPENLGYTASAHRGVVESDADWVLLLNSDTIVAKGWLEGLLDAAASDPQVAFVGPVSNAATYQSVPELYDGAGKWAINQLPSGWTVDDMASFVAQHADRSFPEAPLLNGFCTLIRRSVFVEIGGLDAARFPAGYGEENDLCLRATRSGHKLVIADHVYVYHAKSASFGTARRQELAKAGERTLRALYDDVHFGNLGRRFAEIPALTMLRQRVRKAYAAPDAAADDKP
jgi:GT2 family glycosyltransferase